MPMVTLDGRSLLLDGRRIWLTSGQIAYASLPRDVWADRIWAAKAAGLNCVYTPVIWSRHESRPGKFDFAGENDLPHFIQLIGQAGMYCILGMGPHVAGSSDLGGIPPWVLEQVNVKLRTANTAFLESCSRYLTNLSERVKHLQITSSGSGGPLIMVQCESRWTCGDPVLAQQYLGELLRYIHEAGINVPVINANSLWQGIEGMLDAWTGRDDMLATMRQLSIVRSTQPRMVIDFQLADQPVWGQPMPVQEDPRLVQRRLAEALAGGGQFNLMPFCSGTNLGFSGGRLDTSPDAYAATDTGKGGLLDAAGAHESAYRLVRRVTHLASRFARVFSHFDPTYQPVVIAPLAPDLLMVEANGKKANSKKPSAGISSSASGTKGAAAKPVQGGISIVHATGTQGSVAFLFDQEESSAQAPLGSRTTTLLLHDGSTLPVTLGEQRVAWCLFNVHISGRATLDYTNLCAFATVGQVLVLFGPAGARGRVSVNGSPLDVDVPTTSKEPVIAALEGITVVVANEQQIDHIYAVDDGVYIGVLDVAQDGTPVLPAGTRSYFKVMADGSTRTVTPEQAKTSGTIPDAPSLAPWQAAGVEEYADGSCPRYAKIDAPQDLTRLGCPYGYGWYRITLKGNKARKVRMMMPHSADRLQIFADGKPIGVVGEGPGANSTVSVSLKKGSMNLVALAENLGRFSDGYLLGEPKGLWGPGYEIAEIKGVKARIVLANPIEYLTFRKPMWDVSDGDTTSPERVTWSVPHKRKTRVVMRFDAPAPSGSLLVINNVATYALSPAGPRHIVLTSEQLGKGGANIQVALPEIATDADRERLAAGVTFYECLSEVTDGASFAFAKWEPPTGNVYALPKKGASTELAKWWRSTFTPTETQSALYLECTGLTKGQIYVNGKHAARYFVRTAEGDDVPPQLRYRLPRPWLKPKQANEVMIFDEHGASPAKCRLVYDRGRHR